MPFEGYIHEIIMQELNTASRRTRIEAKSTAPSVSGRNPTSWPSRQRSNIVPKLQGYCSHVVGLIHTLDLWRASDEMSTTSLLQQLHKPRGKKIDAKPITAVGVGKEDQSTAVRTDSSHYWRTAPPPSSSNPTDEFPTFPLPPTTQLFLYSSEWK